MNIFFKILIKVFNLILWPFKGLPPIFGFAFIAIGTGFLAVYIFKHLSNQTLLKKIMSLIKLRFTEIMIYRDDFHQILLSQKEILKLNLQYFVRTIKPAVPIMLIVLTILSQINLRYSIFPISAGEPITIKATETNAPKSENSGDIELILPDSFEILTPAFHQPGSSVTEWRIRGKQNGEYNIGFRIGGDIAHKKLIVGPLPQLFSPHLGQEGFIEKIFNPLERLFPKGASLESIDLGYQSRSFSLGMFGWKFHWLVAFLVISIGFGIFCRFLLKVS